YAYQQGFATLSFLNYLPTHVLNEIQLQPMISLQSLLLFSLLFKTVSALTDLEQTLATCAVAFFIFFIIFIVGFLCYWCMKIDDTERMLEQRAINPSNRNGTAANEDNYRRSPQQHHRQRSEDPQQRPPYPLEDHPLLPRNDHGPEELRNDTPDISVCIAPECPVIQSDVPLTPPPKVHFPKVGFVFGSE
ncbi:hypothetical protein PMAYCL1PPCAC_06208, partial [Pristionchus mayeri]